MHSREKSAPASGKVEYERVIYLLVRILTRVEQQKATNRGDVLWQTPKTLLRHSHHEFTPSDFSSASLRDS